MRALALISTGLILLLGGCEQAVHNMYQQPKYLPLSPSNLFDNGASARPLQPGTVVHSLGQLAGTSSGREGVTERYDQFHQVLPILPGETGSRPPQPTTVSLPELQRGKERFTIYCAPCHSPLGDGDGYITRRGFPHPPSYHSDRLRNAPDQHFYDVITQGYGIMYSYAARISPSDRWAIVAYIRALQRSQHAQMNDVPASERKHLSETNKRG